jgi:hypothetical protein
LEGIRKKQQETGENSIMRSFSASSPNMIRMTKARQMRWARHLAHIEEKRDKCRLLVESQKERDLQEGLHAGRRKR